MHAHLLAAGAAHAAHIKWWGWLLLFGGAYLAGRLRSEKKL